MVSKWVSKWMDLHQWIYTHAPLWECTNVHQWPDRCAKCRWGLGWGVLRKTRSVLKMEDARLYSNTHYQGVEETVCVCG